VGGTKGKPFWAAGRENQTRTLGGVAPLQNDEQKKKRAKPNPINHWRTLEAKGVQKRITGKVVAQKGAKSTP